MIPGAKRATPPHSLECCGAHSHSLETQRHVSPCARLVGSADPSLLHQALPSRALTPTSHPSHSPRPASLAEPSHADCLPGAQRLRLCWLYAVPPARGTIFYPPPWEENPRKVWQDWVLADTQGPGRGLGTWEWRGQGTCAPGSPAQATVGSPDPHLAPGSGRPCGSGRSAGAGPTRPPQPAPRRQRW